MTNTWVDTFNEMLDSDFEHLHQISGWKDIETVEAWDEVTLDIVKGYIKDGDSIFESGCGVLAFLNSVKRLYPNVTIHGLDAGEALIAKIKSMLPPEEAECFFVGPIPHGLKHFPDNHFDVMLANGVTQFISKTEAETWVHEMLRITKPNRNIIISSVCDVVNKEENDQKLRKSWETYGEEDGLPIHSYYPKDWWNRFESDTHRITIKHVTLEHYWRRNFRYNVYIST